MRLKDVNRQERQLHRSQQQQPMQGRKVEKGKEKQEEKGKEIGWKARRKRKGHGGNTRREGTRERGGVEEAVENDVMDGQSRNTRRRRSQGEGGVSEEKETSASAGRTRSL